MKLFCRLILCILSSFICCEDIFLNGNEAWTSTITNFSRNGKSIGGHNNILTWDVTQDTNLNRKSVRITNPRNEWIKKLQVLSSKMEFLPSNLFDVFPKLVELEIFDAGLKEISRNEIDKLSDLEKISLANNSIKEIPEKLFEGNPKLKYIDFRNNLITSIHPNVFDDLENLKMLILSGNPMKLTDSRSTDEIKNTIVAISIKTQLSKLEKLLNGTIETHNALNTSIPIIIALAKSLNYSSSELLNQTSQFKEILNIFNNTKDLQENIKDFKIIATSLSNTMINFNNTLLNFSSIAQEDNTKRDSSSDKFYDREIFLYVSGFQATLTIILLIVVIIFMMNKKNGIKKTKEKKQKSKTEHEYATVTPNNFTPNNFSTVDLNDDQIDDYEDINELRRENRQENLNIGEVQQKIDNRNEIDADYDEIGNYETKAEEDEMPVYATVDTSTKQKKLNVL